ncbi:MAG: GNAT family N-acetyltransferase [Sporichthyaceae bacterium]
MALEFAEIAPSDALDPQVRSDLLHLWVAVTDAGGSVGFAAPAPADAIARTLDASLPRVAAGEDSLGVLRDGDRVVGMGMLVDRGGELTRHWRTVLRVMVHPDHQGGGAGVMLMTGLHALGVRLGLEQLQLTVRGGEGLERFYQRLGYTVVGRHPGAVRVAAGDDRDEIMLVASLS